MDHELRKRGAMRRGSGGRDLKVRVKSGKGRSLSSKLWLERQLNDPYVARARREGWRSRQCRRFEVPTPLAAS